MSYPPLKLTLGRVTGGVLLLLSLALMVGCQGLSAGPGNQPTPGILSFDSTSLDFGSVGAGGNKVVTITATNNETNSVTINSVSFTTKYFSLTSPSLPVTIAAGASATVSVKFTPNAPGNFSAVATISSDATNGVTNISLSGTGSANGQLELNPSSKDFGSVSTGVKQSQTVTLTNTGQVTANISQVSISGTGFQISGISAPLTLNSSQSTTFTVSFAPVVTGSQNGTVTINSDATNGTLTMDLSGTGITQAGTLTSNPTVVGFGNTQVGTTKTLPETITNSGGTSVTISQIAITGAGYSLSGVTTPITLGAGQSTTLNVSFNPQSAGNVNANIKITSDATNSTFNIACSGAGITAGALGSNPTSIPFGSVQVGVKHSVSETITNSGGSSVTISQASISGSGFSMTGISTPLTLTAGQSATFNVSFTPQASGSASGNVAITSNASNPALNIPLSGTGTTAGALGSNPTSIPFGSVQVGVKQTISETVTNNGGSSVTISQASVSGSGFSITGITTPVTLGAGQSATFNVSFTPQASGSASGNVAITSNASNPTLNIPLSGTGTAAGALGSNPTSIPFGSVLVGIKQTISETVTNNGGSSVTISQASVSGSGFSMTGITTPVTLTAGHSATFSVSFTPSAAGSASGNVTITSNASNPTLTIPLSGTGTVAVGQLAASPTTLGIGNVVVGDSGTGTGTLTASGASVTVTAASSNNSAFSISGLSLPVTIQAGNSTSFTVTFSPTNAGAASATLTFTSTAQPGTTTETATGTGKAAQTHSVALSWNASTSSNISGYNIYRAAYTSSCGAFSKINSSLDAATSYVDSTVINASAYCYATTAVDSNSNESGYSNIVSNLQIPAQ